MNTRNLSNVARVMGVSYTSIQTWAKNGWPINVTKGLSWYEHAQAKDKGALAKQARSTRDQQKFIEESRELVEDTLKELGRKLKAGQFEAKPADLNTLIRLHALLDQTDQEKKNWMDTIMVHILTEIAEVVNTQQFAVIRTKLLNLNTEETGTLDVVSKSVPSLPVHPSEYSEPTVDVDYTDVTNAD